MRDRDRNHEAEAAWARELDRVQTPAVERLASDAEALLRAEGASLADVRSAWAEFARDNLADAQRDDVRAQHIAYARVVDDLLRQETGEGLRERHPSDVVGSARPAETRPEDWYLSKARALEVGDARAFASVEREVGRLKDLSQLATREAAAQAVARTAVDFERDRAGADIDKLRTRLYALALIHELRTLDATNPGRKNVRAPGPVREIVELVTKDILIATVDPRVVEGVEREPEATLSTRLSAHYRERAKDIGHELANVAAAADRELFALRREAETDVAAAREVADVYVALARLLATRRSHDPVDLAAKVNELRERERNEPDITEGRLRPEWLAYGALAREAYVRQHALLCIATRDAMQEIEGLPAAERESFEREVAVLLQEPAYNDRQAMGRELLRADDDQLVRHCALARTTPSLQELERDARWRDPAFHQRVDQRVSAHLLAPDRDAELQRALAEARVRVVLAGIHERSAARDKAVELAEVLRRLPVARSLDVETSPKAFRPLHA